MATRDQKHEQSDEPNAKPRPTPGAAEGEPGGNDPKEVGPGPTPSKAEGEDRRPKQNEFTHT